MPLGMQNATNITMDMLENMSNVTSFPEFMINVNNDIYSGFLFLILLFTIWVILFIQSFTKNGEVMRNILTSGAIVTVLSLFLRGIFIYQDGVARGLLTDFQLWIFPLITVITGMIMWMTKD